jgi:hypothetical protein
VSTNFYLVLDPKPCGECGRGTNEGDIHIGKRSMGWVFTWQGFEPEQSPSGTALNDAETWRAFLAQEIQRGGHIQNEYREWLALVEFFAEVDSLRGNRRQSVVYPGTHIRAAGPDDVSYGEWF